MTGSLGLVRFLPFNTLLVIFWAPQLPESRSERILVYGVWNSRF